MTVAMALNCLNVMYFACMLRLKWPYVPLTISLEAAGKKILSSLPVLTCENSCHWRSKTNIEIGKFHWTKFSKYLCDCSLYWYLRLALSLSLSLSEYKFPVIPKSCAWAVAMQQQKYNGSNPLKVKSRNRNISCFDLFQNSYNLVLALIGKNWKWAAKNRCDL